MFDAPSGRRRERDDALRVAVLDALDLLDTPVESQFDTIAQLTATMLGCPVALISLITRDRYWIKAAHGTAHCEMRRSDAICNQTIAEPGVLVIEDGSVDTRIGSACFADGSPIAFYAGTAIHGIDAHGVSHAIGTLCVLDRVPRRFSEAHRTMLSGLASLVDALIAARATACQAMAVARENEQQAIELRRKDRIFHQAERMAMIGSWRVAFAGQILEWSDGQYRIHDLEPDGSIEARRAYGFYSPTDQVLMREKLADTLATGTPYALETEIITAKGRRRRLRSTAEIEYRDGRAIAITGVSRDVTDEHAMQQALRHAADTDELTGIGNRAAFNRTIDAAIASARANATPLALVLIDMDGFKAVNDTFGHLAGDTVLCTVGNRLGNPWLRGSFAARIGGDEFAILIDDPQLLADLDLLTTRLRTELQVPVTLDGLTIATAGSVGAVLFADHFATAADFVGATDRALYAAKKQRIGDRRIAGRPVA
ncbi:sensor domain-containing diguanylate cyclase [Sphingomonas sp. Leaf17]|uniref:sensor domain-containing diguanylate cyclase n=1 Tax=Sphingomonas sp. Leaf17 TaxID=1735683 RepID=UPI00138F2FAC|nr:sensor domain-containing diguanylate cyclase [Sphingomonas sp. Leaf17]